MVYLLFYNGYNIEKKFSKEYLNHIYYDQIARCFHEKNVLIPDLKASIDWDRSTRKQLHVLNKEVYKRLLQCEGRYYWPNGYRFLCRPYKTRRQGYREHCRLAEHTDNFEKIQKLHTSNKPHRQKRRRLRSPSSVETVKCRHPSTPIPDNWCEEELESYARINGYYDRETDRHLEEGEILENSSSMGSLDKHLSNLNVINK